MSHAKSICATSADLDEGRETVSFVLEDPAREGRVIEDLSEVDEGDTGGLEVSFRLVKGFEAMVDLEVSGRLV